MILVIRGFSWFWSDCGYFGDFVYFCDLYEFGEFGDFVAFGDFSEFADLGDLVNFGDFGRFGEFGGFVEFGGFWCVNVAFQLYMINYHRFIQISNDFTSSNFNFSNCQRNSQM